MNARWQPLLEGGEAERVREVVRSDARASVAALLEGDGAFDLADGAVGASLLLGELERSGLAEGLPSAEEALRVARRRMRAAGGAGGLWHGAAGFAWARAQITGRHPGRGDMRRLVGWVGRQERFDLIDGVAGAGVLGLELAEAGDALTRAVVARLAALACAHEHGVAWLRRPGPTHAVDDLGMAHGQAGVIAFLAGAAARHEPARDLLARASRRLVAQARPRPSPWAFAHVRGQASSRLAWCYGDPGVAVALARAARALGSEELAAVARDVAVRAAGRLGDPSVADASLCHGSAGLAHVFARLWQYTGEEVCAEAARSWMRRALQQRVREGVRLPFPSGWRRHGTLRFRDDPGLVTGAVGACLAILAATEARDPRWDRSMLLSAA